jgi:hypothetical protein
LSNLTEHQSMICNKFPARHSYAPFSKLGPVTPQKRKFSQKSSSNAETP